LVHHREMAMRIPDDINNAIEYSGKDKLIYVMFKLNDKYHWANYNINQKKFLQMMPDIKMLEMIQCTEATPTAGIDPIEIERASDICIEAWSKRNGVSFDAIY
jgi:hypothetical protein